MLITMQAYISSLLLSLYLECELERKSILWSGVYSLSVDLERGLLRECGFGEGHFLPECRFGVGVYCVSIDLKQNLKSLGMQFQVLPEFIDCDTIYLFEFLENIPARKLVFT